MLFFIIVIIGASLKLLEKLKKKNDFVWTNFEYILLVLEFPYFNNYADFVMRWSDDACMAYSLGIIISKNNLCKSV